MGSYQRSVECEMCGAEAYEDEAEGFCPECGNAWIVNESLFEDRIKWEFGELE